MATERSGGARHAPEHARAPAKAEGTLAKVQSAGGAAFNFAKAHWGLFALGAAAFLAWRLLNNASVGAAGAVAGGALAGAGAGAAGIAGPQGQRGPAGRAGQKGPSGASAAFVYRTRGRQTFAQVARAYGISVAELAHANPGLSYGASRPHAGLRPGVSILVPRSRRSVLQLRAQRQLRRQAKAGP